MTGLHIEVDMGDDDEAEVGSFFFVTHDGDDWVASDAPDGLWEERRLVGRVLRAHQDWAVVALGNDVLSADNHLSLNLNTDDLVEMTNTGRVSRIVDKAADHKMRNEAVDPAIGSIAEPSKYSIFDSGDETIDDFIGTPSLIQQVHDLIDQHGRFREDLLSIGIKPVKGALFTGSPGTGKTMLGRIVANSTESRFLQIRGPELVSQWLGESEAQLRAVFAEARQVARAVIFFDEIDTISARRSGDSHEASRRLVGQFLAELDGFDQTGSILVIGTTNRREDMDTALLRPGRFDVEINFEHPDRAARVRILERSSAKIRTQENLPHDRVADLTEGWSPAQLVGIWKAAGLYAVKDGRKIVMTEDYLAAVKTALESPHR